MMLPRLNFAFVWSLLLLAGATMSVAAGTADKRYYIAGPVEAELVSVIDGYTVMVNARRCNRGQSTCAFRQRA